MDMFLFSIIISTPKMTILLLSKVEFDGEDDVASGEHVIQFLHNSFSHDIVNDGVV